MRDCKKFCLKKQKQEQPIQILDYGITDGHEWIKIGGVKWATMNVGANSITDTGLYFAWGDTQGYAAEQVGSEENQKYFSAYYDDYKWYNSVEGSGFTKYNTEDGLTTLQSSDDTATTAWGNNWRMPTYEEFQELSEVTTGEWVTNYEDSGVDGMVFTLNTDSSIKLFFPACGNAQNGYVYDEGMIGYYWSSSAFNDDGAYHLYFSDGWIISQSSLPRSIGLVVRPVLAK